MKGDGEGKMNTVEKQCVVHVCSRPAIVGSSQSATVFLAGIYFVDFTNRPQFIHISPARDIFLDCRPPCKSLSRGNTVLHRALGRARTLRMRNLSLAESSSRVRIETRWRTTCVAIPTRVKAKPSETRTKNKP